MMSKYLQPSLILVSFSLASWALTPHAIANPILIPHGDYVFPTTMSELGIQEPSNFDGPQVPTCEIAKKSAVNNYNSYMTVFGESQDLSVGIIGKTLFVKMSWCHYDVGNPANFVVMTMTGTEQQIARDAEEGRITSGPMFITVFDENGYIIKWSY